MKIVVTALCAALVLMIGCKDEDSTCLTCPGQTVTPTLQNIWPNANQTSWTYDYEMREWEGDLTIYPTREQIPPRPLPTWTEIFDLVESHAPMEPYATIPRVYTMQFDGMTTTGSGVTAQNLTTALETVTGESVEQSSVGGVPVLFQRLCAVRPDLRDKILSSLGESDVPGLLTQDAQWPLFLHGGAWEKTTKYIGSYSDLDQRLFWKFLTDKLSPGSEFSYQLIPDVSTDVVLHCRVYRRLTVTTDAGTFEKALDCLYILDYGILTVTNLSGDPLGYARMFDYGRVIYAPTIGPVHSYERWGAEPGNPPSEGFLDITVSLTGSSTIED